MSNNSKTLNYSKIQSLNNILTIIYIKLGTCNQEQDMCIWTVWAFSASVDLVYFGDPQPQHAQTLTTPWFYSGRVDPLIPGLAL